MINEDKKQIKVSTNTEIFIEAGRKIEVLQRIESKIETGDYIAADTVLDLIEVGMREVAEQIRLQTMSIVKTIIEEQILKIENIIKVTK